MVRTYAFRLILLAIPASIAGCVALPIFPEKVNTAIFHNNIYWSETVPMWIFDPEFRQRYREYRQRVKDKDARFEETQEP